MPAFYNGRQLGQGEFAIVLDGITYFGSAVSFNTTQAADEPLRVDVNGIVTNREGAIELNHVPRTTVLDTPPFPAVNAPPAVELAADQSLFEPTPALDSLLVSHIGHSDALPERGNFNTLYCVFGYPMAFIYRENVVDVPDNHGVTGYFPTNVDAAAVARRFSDGAFMPVDSGAGSIVLDSSWVQFAYNHNTLLLARCVARAPFGVDAAFLLSSGPSALWTDGPWFHRRTLFDFDRAAVAVVNDFTRVNMREDNFFRRIFPTVIQSFPASPIDPPQPHDDDDVPAPVAESAAASNRRRLILD